MRAQNLANGAEGHTDWNAVNWREVNGRVRNLRRRIFRATREGNYRKGRGRQKRRFLTRHFASQSEAQRFFEAAVPGDPHRLDSDGDGYVCESLP